MISRDLWLIDRFSYKDTSPPWICPICKTGNLKGNKETLKIEQTLDTKKARRIHNYEKDGVTSFRFAGFMHCQNNLCNERIAIAGKGLLHSVLRNEPVSIHYMHDRISVYIPQYFEPPLDIFQIPDTCPSSVRAQIIRSFSHYFSDLHACANAIRASLELIMDDKGIERTDKRNKLIFLGSRIKKFCTDNPQFDVYIEAVKWIGNAGSHFDILTKEEILDGYELLEFIIFELYERAEHQKNLKEKASKINQKNKQAAI